MALIEEEYFPAYIERVFTVLNMASQESRTITQFQFTNWPDHGAPENVNEMIDFVFATSALCVDRD